uniref:Uncharacterized protein n=1 Tax=Listeria monocytogenes TaxID=1639 RepID=A0A0U2VCS6_LISMN|nr:hypothetical protein [Listeria monocytogenes]
MMQTHLYYESVFLSIKYRQPDKLFFIYQYVIVCYLNLLDNVYIH